MISHISRAMDPVGIIYYRNTLNYAFPGCPPWCFPTDTPPDAFIPSMASPFSSSGIGATLSALGTRSSCYKVCLLVFNIDYEG